MWIRLWIIVLYFCLFLLLSFWKVKIVLDSVNWIWQLESFHLAQDLCSFTRNCNAFHTICQTSFEISHYIWNYNAFHTIYKLIFHIVRGKTMHFVFHIKFNLENFTLYDIVMHVKLLIKLDLKFQTIHEIKIRLTFNSNFICSITCNGICRNRGIQGMSTYM